VSLRINLSVLLVDESKINSSNEDKKIIIIVIIITTIVIWQQQQQCTTIYNYLQRNSKVTMYLLKNSIVVIGQRVLAIL